MDLIQLIYVSNAQNEMATAELESLLAVAARNNSACGVTGMLLYAHGSFLQILEGEATAVDTTFAHICRDPRHTNIFILAREAIGERSFARWSMGFRHLGHADSVAHPAYAPFFEHGFDAAAFGVRPGLAVNMLNDFARGQSAAARL